MHANVLRHSPFSSRVITLFVLGCLGIFSVAMLDILYWHTTIFAEGIPQFSVGYIARSALIFISVLVMFLALLSKRWQYVARFDDDQGRMKIAIIVAALSFSLLFLLLFMFRHALFSAYSLEDAPVEWASAVFLFCGSALFFIACFRAKYRFLASATIYLSLALLSFILFIIAMEEVSWFQRVLTIQTPEMFANTPQHEMNLHNFATDYFENGYYFGTYLFTVILPFVYLLFPRFSSWRYLRIFIARPFVMMVGFIPCAYNFDMWNISWMQGSFFASIIILVSIVLFSRDRMNKLLSGGMMVLMIVTQCLLLSHGENFARIWEVTEYKELFIALILFLYSLDVLFFLNREYSLKDA
ncbi:MAG: hypothetical protein Q9M26_04695 [Mariprofundales bacterium]|nr:hypothetical protein [Mariprofundales bacterium]